MIHVKFDGSYEEVARNLNAELSEKYPADGVSESYNAAGYAITLRLGDPEIACIEVFEAVRVNAEFFCIISVSFGYVVETYVTKSMHSLMLFLKEFAPVIANTNKLQSKDLT